MVTSINLGTVEQTLQFTAPTAASADTITVSLTDHNSTTFSVAIASTFNSADSARTVACEFVSAANALFSAQGVSYNAFETSAGEVKVIFGSSAEMGLSTFTAAITTSSTSASIALTAASALPQNRTTADISSIVTDQLNASFSANGVLRQATDLGDGIVKLVWASTDNIPLTPSITSVTTGIDFTASQTTLTGGTITVGGVSVELSTTAGLTAANIATQVKAALFANDNYNTASGRTLLDSGSGDLTITYSALDGEVEDITVTSFTDSRNPAVSSTINENRAYGDLDATFELVNGDKISLRGTPNFSAGTVVFARDSVAQQDTFTISGDYQTGDSIEFRVDDKLFTYTVTNADVSSANGTYSNALANKNIVDSIAEAMTENVHVSEIVSSSVARDMDITNDDRTYLILTAREPGTRFLASSVLNRATGSSTSLISSETTRSNVDAGSNNLLISEDLTINLLGSDGEPESFKHRGPKVVMDINRSFSELTALRSSDLIINGQTVNLSLAKDDELSPEGVNRNGSAISKAEAINGYLTTPVLELLLERQF